MMSVMQSPSWGYCCVLNPEIYAQKEMCLLVRSNNLESVDPGRGSICPMSSTYLQATLWTRFLECCLQNLWLECLFLDWDLCRQSVHQLWDVQQLQLPQIHQCLQESWISGR